MQNDNDEMIVNEFESLEAAHYEKSTRKLEHADLCTSLSDYYFDMLLKFSNEVLNERI